MAKNRDQRDPLTPPPGVAVQIAAPQPAFDDYTGQHAIGAIDAETLKQSRAKRPTEERFEHLEAKNDEQDKTLGKISAAVAKIEGRLEILPTLIADALDAKKASRKVLTRAATGAAAVIGAYLAHRFLGWLGV